jgi:O-antigen ligase
MRSVSWTIPSGTRRGRFSATPAVIFIVTVLTGGFVLLIGLDPTWFAIVLGLLVLVGVAASPRFVVYSMLAIVSFFEVLSPDFLMKPASILATGDSSLGLVVNPLEVLLFVGMVSWLAHSVARRRLVVRGGALAVPIALFFCISCFGLLRGLAAGGDGRIAFWESRYLFVLFACYFLTAQLITTEQQIGRVRWIFLIATGAFAIEGAIRRVAWDTFVGSTVSLEGGYDHTDPVFLGAAIILILAQFVFGASRGQRLFGIGLLPILGFTLLATERRAGFVALVVCLMVLGLLLLVSRRRAFVAIFVPLTIVAALYFPLFWNSTNLVAQPARAVQSLFDPNARDAASNAYRIQETTNIAATIAQDPWFGVGFGREFLFVVPLPDLSTWEFWHFEPHNNVLWIWLKTGFFGFVAFLVVAGSAIQRATRVALSGEASQTRAMSVFVLAVVLISLVVSYVDVALVLGARVPAILGIAMGLLPALDPHRTL